MDEQTITEQAHDRVLTDDELAQVVGGESLSINFQG